MDNGYRVIVKGNLQQGDEYQVRGQDDWRQVKSGFNNPSYDDYEYRRPIAQDDEIIDISDKPEDATHYDESDDLVNWWKFTDGDGWSYWFCGEWHSKKLKPIRDTPQFYASDTKPVVAKLGGIYEVHPRVREIENKIAQNELSAAQVFTQMNQLIPRVTSNQPELPDSSVVSSKIENTTCDALQLGVCEVLYTSSDAIYVKADVLLIEEDGNIIYRFLEGERAGELQEIPMHEKDYKGNVIFRPIQPEQTELQCEIDMINAFAEQNGHEFLEEELEIIAKYVIENVRGK
jgi:hypothetical protein